MHKSHLKLQQAYNQIIMAPICTTMATLILSSILSYHYYTLLKSWSRIASLIPLMKCSEIHRVGGDCMMSPPSPRKGSRTYLQYEHISEGFMEHLFSLKQDSWWVCNDCFGSIQFMLEMKLLIDKQEKGKKKKRIST